MAEETDVPPSRWLSVWVRDQSFWRDVASRTLAGFIVVGLTVLAGGAVGLIRLPEVALLLSGLLLAAVLSGVQAWIFTGPRFTGLPRSESKRVRRVLFLAFLLLSSVLLVGTFFWGVNEGERLRERCDAGVTQDCR